MSDDLLLVITPLRKALERFQRKAQPLLETPRLLQTKESEDLLDVICMQFLAAGEALKRLDKLRPGLLAHPSRRSTGKEPWVFVMSWLTNTSIWTRSKCC